MNHSVAVIFNDVEIAGPGVVGCEVSFTSSVVASVVVTMVVEGVVPVEKEDTAAAGAFDSGLSIGIDNAWRGMMPPAVAVT